VGGSSAGCVVCMGAVYGSPLPSQQQSQSLDHATGDTAKVTYWLGATPACTRATQVRCSQAAGYRVPPVLNSLTLEHVLAAVLEQVGRVLQVQLVLQAVGIEQAGNAVWPS